MGKGNRKSVTGNRNEKWKNYVSNLSEPFKVIVLKDKLSKKQALILEEKVLNRIDWFYEDLTTNIDKSEPNSHFIEFKIGIKQESFENEKLMRFQNKSDTEIAKTLLTFPNENSLTEFKKGLEKLNDYLDENYDELEEKDEDIFIDIESVLDSLNEIAEEYEISEKQNITEFKSDIKRERMDVEFILENDASGIQKKFSKKILKFIDEYS